MSSITESTSSKEAHAAGPVEDSGCRVDAAEQRELRRIAKLLVGSVGLREAVALLRGAMLEEALERGKGSRHAAARLLGVNRRAIQRLVADLGL